MASVDHTRNDRHSAALQVLVWTDNGNSTKTPLRVDASLVAKSGAPAPSWATSRWKVSSAGSWVEMTGPVFSVAAESVRGKRCGGDVFPVSGNTTCE